MLGNDSGADCRLEAGFSRVGAESRALPRGVDELEQVGQVLGTEPLLEAVGHERFAAALHRGDVRPRTFTVSPPGQRGVCAELSPEKMRIDH